MKFNHYALYDDQGQLIEEIHLCDSCNENDDIELDGEGWRFLGFEEVECCDICGEDGW